MAKKNNLLQYLILLIITLTFTEAVFFLLVNSSQWTGHFWISLFCVIIAELITFGYLIYADIRNINTPAPVKLSSGLLITLYDSSVILSILFFWLYLKVDLKLYLIIQFTFIWVLLITAVILFHFKRHMASGKIDSMNFVQIAGNAVHELSNHLEIMNSAGKYDSLIRAVATLQEKINYSDPVSSPALLEAEKKIITSIKELNLKFSTPQTNDDLIYMATEKIQRIIGEIDKRNRLLTIFK